MCRELAIALVPLFDFEYSSALSSCCLQSSSFFSFASDNSESKHLRSHAFDVASVIQWALGHESKTISRVGAKALRRVIESTCTIGLIGNPTNDDLEQRKEVPKGFELMSVLR